MAKRNPKIETVVTPAYEFNAQVFGALGREMAEAAAQQTSAAGNYWDRSRTLYVEAQNNGKAQEALDAMFGPGDKVKGKKAPWYRAYKSQLTSCLKLGITVDNSMGMTAVAKLIKGAKEAAADDSAEASAAKDAQLLDMFKKMAQGCLNRGIDKKQLATILKELEA